MRLAICIFLLGPGLSLAQTADSPEVLVDTFLRKGVDRFDNETRLRLQSALAKTPKTMAIVTGRFLAKKDIAKEDEYEQVQRGIRLLGGALDESAVKELTILIDRFKGSENNVVQLRHNIMVALSANTIGRGTLVETKTDDVVNLLNSYLSREDSPYVLRLGLRINSSYAKELSEPMLANAKKYLSNSDISNAQRRIKMNQAQNYDTLYGNWR